VAKVFHITFRWVRTPLTADLVARVDSAIGTLGNWYRFNGYTWFVGTDRTALDLYNAVRTLMHTDDTVVVSKIEVGDNYGWAPPQFWEWLEREKFRVTS
jgi:hypothetical protein